jgi:hypothetical protein
MKGFLFLFLSINFISTLSFARCAVEDINPAEKFLTDLQMQIFSQTKLMNTSSSTINTIPVVFHVIESVIPESVFDKQIDALNIGYALTGFQFSLQEVNFIPVNKWQGIGAGNSTERDLKRNFRKGDSTTLNVYVLPNLGKFLGWATLPWDYSSRPEMDGVVLSANTLPIVGRWPFNEGATMTHEVGHWMGLFHTFQGGCFGNGDFVDDTPAQQAPTFGCPIPQDSCSNNPGLDPVNNFMDYSDDACLTEFSQGQILRMNASFTTYRIDDNSWF